MKYCTGVVAASLAIAPAAWAQFSPITQERSVQGSAQLTSGEESSGAQEAIDFSLFSGDVSRGVKGADSASASVSAIQNSTISADTITGSLSASGSVVTGSSFVVGQSDGFSAFLVIFSVGADTQVNFAASGSMKFLGINPDGEPADLYGVTRVSLVNADTFDPIAGFQFQGGDYTNDAQFSGTLAAGTYAILARAEFHGYSADLLGPPARSGSGESSASFRLTVVPAPASAVLFAAGLMGAARRRR
ncbi:MAG TPA: PEP-CTERM sorting domain-containing protein [Phycisphaerales bacterium]|nr:PEP-CTERM sorting domain-containing protein [Phycisphaerales bacterium]